VDATGRIAVRLPDGWRAEAGHWDGPDGPGTSADPALVVSSDPARWGADTAVPGAFVWLSRTSAFVDRPAAFVAGRPHTGCDAAPVRRSRQARIDWVIADFRCADGRGRMVEAAGTGTAGAGLVYVQIAPPAGSDPAFVDTLLAGVRVR
jgi:hypothetical protein